MEDSGGAHDCKLGGLRRAYEEGQCDQRSEGYRKDIGKKRIPDRGASEKP